MPAPNREQLNRAAQSLVRAAARRLRMDVVAADYYSPIVRADEVPAELWERQAPMPGLELDLDAQLALIEHELRPLIDEFDVPLGPQPPDPLFLENPWYGPMDAHVLYALVRHTKPRRVLELGSGFSTLIIDRALSVTAGPTTHQVVDPYPSALLTHLSAELRVESAADAPQALFDALGSGDVLFVDTSHTVRPGGEVNRLILEVLPSLAPGVLVHFHDIFRPYEYPRALYEQFNVHWQEQYLLQAFLAYNPNFRIVCSNHALWRQHPERCMRVFKGLGEAMAPGAFWFARL